MIPILVVIVLVILCNLLVTAVNGIKDPGAYSAAALTRCNGPHSWSYNHLDQLQCMDCNFISGVDTE